MGWQDAPIVDAPAAAPAWQSAPEVPQADASQWGPSMEAVNAAMLGTGPKVNQWLTEHLWPSIAGPPVNADQQQAQATAWEQQNPNASRAANVAGVIAGSAPYALAGEALAPLGWGARALGMGAAGAGVNAGAAEINGQDPATAALTGAAGGVGGELGATALTSAGGKLASAILNRGVNIPSASALKPLSSGQYDALRANPTVLPLSDGTQLAQDTIDTLGNKGLYTKGPGTVEIFNKFLKPQGAVSPGSTPVGITLGGLEEARQNLNAIIRRNPASDDAAAATVGKQSIDTYLQSKAATDPSISQFLDDAQVARANWRAAKTSDVVTNSLDKATGQGITNLADNSSQLIAKRANSILQQPKLSGGMSPDELSALEGLRSGSPVRNLAQGLGAATGHTGIGLAVAIPQLLMQISEHGLNPNVILPTAAAMGVGMGAHRLANALAEKQGQGVASLIRSNSPAFRDAIASGASTAPVDVGPTQLAARKLTSALAARALAQQGQQQP